MIGILDYGMGNLRSVQKALEYLGERAVVSGDKAVLDGCDKLILPGVGSFAAGMAEMNGAGLSAYVKERAKDTKMLGICLGMQFLLERSFEEGETEGLGFVKGSVVRFTQGKIPQPENAPVRRHRSGHAVLLCAQLPRRLRGRICLRQDGILRRIPFGGVCGQRVRGTVPPRKERRGGAETSQKLLPDVKNGKFLFS